MAARDETDLCMSVKLDGGGRICNVLVSSQTTGQDVVECLKPDDDKVYYLVEIWKGCERPIGHREKLKTVLLQWGSDADDVTFLLKEKSSRHNNSQKKMESPRSSPVQFQDHVREQQVKVESMERELHEKEKYLNTLRSKEASKNGLKSNYVRRLELRVLEQEEQLKSLRYLEQELFKYRVDNEKLALELHRLRSMFALKHQQLSEATARVELLARQLSQKRRDDMLHNDLRVPLEEELKDQKKTTVMESDLQPHHYMFNQTDNQPAPPTNHHPGERNNPRLTEAQIQRLKTNMLHNRPTVAATKHLPAENGGVFLEHVISQEHHNLNNLLLWRDDDENDTETSADSGHVSVDSPSYQTGDMDTSFHFGGNHPGMHIGKIEHFDMDQEFGFQPQERKDIEVGEMSKPQKVMNNFGVSSSGVPLYYNSLPRTKHRSGKPSVARSSFDGKLPVGQTDYQKPLFIQTDDQRSVVNSLRFPGPHPKHDSPQSTSSLSSQSSQLSVSNSDVEIRTGSPKPSERNRTRSAKSVGFEHPRRRDTEAPSNDLETNTDRTLGSISLFQRSRGDCDSPTPKDRSSRRVSDPMLGRTSTDTISEKKPPLHQRNREEFNSSSPKDRSSRRASDPMLGTPAADIPGKKTPLRQRNRGNCDSPTPKERSTRRKSDLKLELCRVDTKSIEGHPPAAKDLSASQVNDTKAESSGSDTIRETNPASGRQPVPSPGVQDLLDGIPGLKITGGDVKPFQIQTRAEKDSENDNKSLSAEKTVKKTSSVQSPIQDSKLTTDAKSVAIPRVAPKPVPRKRSKTPPARNSVEVGSLVVTSAGNIGKQLTSSFEDSTVATEDSTVATEDSRGEENGPSSDKKQVTNGDQAGEQNTKTGEKVPGCVSRLRRKEEKPGSKKSGKRVSLDPHAVLLHASLDGELDVVKSIIHQVEDPSYPNTEGLTALHHAVCNNHEDIVKFLIEYGCDINAADMQGWTSLHCAAANNSVELSKFLVTHGACVFAVTAIEGKTPSRCCEKDSENFDACFSYLSDLENNFGVSNAGVVYAVYAYQANRKDELSFESGEHLIVVRRGDVTEKEWWWARDSRGQLGYIPRNLLGLYPRIAPDV